ncbi:MAG: aldolase [Methylocystis sp.]|nr:MAG: aldolase [Methylocystis sp.]
MILSADAPGGFSAPPGHRASALLLRLGPVDEAGARAQARDGARAFINATRALAGAPPVFVQIAPVRTPVHDADLDALAGAWPDGVFLEACEGRADVQALSAKLAAREAMAGVAEGATRIVALAAQTPAGVFALGGYGQASARLAGLALDDGPLPGDAQAKATVRTLLALGAAAAGVPALLIAPAGVGPTLAAACAAARREGFSGMLARFPGQIPAIEAALAGP